ncbi:MAG: hypothetical protein A2Z18_00560 [Armatimonadetes bacterium RBG_16_58_9]|nr:MAG: hypothetical protein A2Z18_00560 [Armatimonadetes bacterium RBG_16_58_9]
MGQVVGYSHFYDGTQWVDRAFIWEEAAGMVELPTFGAKTSGAVAINNSGQIAGWIRGEDEVARSVLWNPIPELASLLALFTGMAGIGALVCRRRNAT